MWKVFCGKQLFKQNPCSGVCAERAGTLETGIQDAGSGDSGVLESEIYESGIQVCRNQRFGWGPGFQSHMEPGMCL